MTQHDGAGDRGKLRREAERWLVFVGLLTCAAVFCHMYLQMYLRAISQGRMELVPSEFSIGLAWGVVFPVYTAAIVIGKCAGRMRAPLYLLHNPLAAIAILGIARRHIPLDLCVGSVCGFTIGMAVAAFIGGFPSLSSFRSGGN